MNTSGEENESKYFGDPTLFLGIRDIYKLQGFERCAFTKENIEDVYFDTKDAFLTLNGVLYRIRKTTSDYIATYKEPMQFRMDGTVHRAREIEEKIPSQNLDEFLLHNHSNLPSLSVRVFLSKYEKDISLLKPLLKISNDRSAIWYKREKTIVEVTLDSPVYHSPEDDIEPIQEYFIEVEFKKDLSNGDYNLFKEFDSALMRQFNLRPCRLNKVQHALTKFIQSCATKEKYKLSYAAGLILISTSQDTGSNQ